MSSHSPSRGTSANAPRTAGARRHDVDAPIPQADRTLRRVVIAAAVFTAATVIMGSIVAATDSSAACPAWPQCYPDQIRPDIHIAWLENPAIEMFHRTVSGLCLVFLALTGWRARGHRDARVRVLPWVALGCAVAAAVFGMIVVLFHLPPVLAMLDVGCALAALFLITVTAVTLLRPRIASPPSVPMYARAALVASMTLLVVHMAGVIVAGSTSDGYRSFTRVIGWPMWQIVPIDGSPALQVARIVLVLVALAAIVMSVVGALRAGRRVTPLLLAALTVAELVMGLMIGAGGLADAQTNGIHPELAIAYAATATTILWVVSALAAAAVPGGRAVQPASAPQAPTERRTPTAVA